MKVLITGARGTIGSKLVPALENDCDLRLLSRAHVPGDPRWLQVDLGDFRQTREALEDIEMVIHLAIASGRQGDYEGEAFNSERFDTNVKGTYHLFQAAHQAGVRRVIYTSSLTVVWGYPYPAKVAGDAPARPVGTYALTKQLGEQIAAYFAAVYRLPSLTMRIPAPIDIDDPKSRETPILPQWIAFPDLVQAYQLALKAPDIDRQIITIVGESSKRRWDLSLAEGLLGYRAQCRLEEMGYTLRQEPDTYEGQGVVWGA